MARNRDDYDDREDDDRPRRRERDDHDDRPRRSWRDNTPATNSLNVCGLIGMIIGIPSAIVTFFPCCGWMFGLPGGLVSLILGVIGLMLAKKSEGRMGGGLAVASTILGGIAVAISVAWMLFFTVAAVTTPTNPGTSTGTPVSPTDPIAASVTAADLAKEYKDNEDAADAKYKGKVVEVTGKVKLVSDTGGNSDITVELDGFAVTGVDCNFSSSQRAALSGLLSGSTVTIRGRCAGEILFDVILNDCIVMPGGPSKPGGEGVSKGSGDGAVKVTASKLFKAYVDNAVSAVATYEDKTVEVSGTVTGIDRTDPDMVKVGLGTGKKLEVQCQFAAKDRAALAAVKEGQQITVRGTCVGNDDNLAFVTVEECKLVK